MLQNKEQDSKNSKAIQKNIFHVDSLKEKIKWRSTEFRALH